VLSHPIARLRHKIDLTLKTTACGALALAAVLVALGFFCAAAFVWIAQEHGTIAAALVLGGAFVVLALIAVLVAVVVRRRNPPPPPGPMNAWWADPALVATALEVARTLGRRRMTSAVLVGAFLVGVLLHRPSRKSEP
jgi:NADH:ubiquinone oxidoreductase subunit 5 (subunit L)/multisubunit Na+/H+ antiporter MnhA subunit